MGRFSILPSSWSGIETFIAGFFLLCAGLIIGPWILFILFDSLLYIWRLIAYEFPYFGGRARGELPPKAPTLTERPGGDRRRMSIAGLRKRRNSISKIPGWQHQTPSIISDVSTGRRRSSTTTAKLRLPSHLEQQPE
ncbi:Hypothetical predicted protein [Lecanosticta acicola]|uniref:Uncharacterized protein n=1 Tax=Lecanosticta acicola TaxID=111012 RepID=A0AAI9E7R7_9PEZI|nr:Hypothetical predicted protein [Lecanosticta acicola]